MSGAGPAECWEQTELKLERPVWKRNPIQAQDPTLNHTLSQHSVLDSGGNLWGRGHSRGLSVLASHVGPLHSNVFLLLLF